MARRERGDGGAGRETSAPVSFTTFRADEQGATAAMFAIVFSGMLLASAVAIDFARSTAAYTREQYALDAAALAAADALGLPDQDSQGRSIAKAYFQANTAQGEGATLDSIKLDAAAGEVTAKAHSRVASSLMKVFGGREITIGAGSRVAKGDQTFEIALVLDNSGSMGGTYINDLKTAAKNLVSTMFTGSEGNGKVSIGVVPFAGSVNVGANNRTASWIDDEGVSSIHHENVSTPRTRLQLFDDMGVAWAGCVEVRPGALAVTDTTPVAANGDSYFVPMLSPDEPDNENNGGASYSNSYLTDDLGSCPRQPTVCTRYDTRGRCTRTSKTPLDPVVAQARICKYAGQAPSTGSSSVGPNANCRTEPIQPLTTDRAAVDSHIDSLVAAGSTNIGEGLMWGWRVLSPSEPFTEGKAYNTPKNNKIIVLMTDGENTYYAADNHNKSSYGAYGYAIKNRLGASYTDSALRATMNTNLVQACANAKAAGITIYSIAFRLESDPTTQSLLKGCAITPDKFFAASNGSALISVFQQIAKDLNRLRVAG